MSSEVQILEVGLRDGLQNEEQKLSLKEKIFLAEQLSQTGLKRIELGSFVSPRWVPQMSQTKDLVIHILNSQKQGFLDSQIEYSALVPNQKGLEEALKTGLKSLSIFLSSTESFSKKNRNCSREKAYQDYQTLCKKALEVGVKIRAYLSVCFECPYEGKVDPKEVLYWIQKIKDLGVYEISISDTTGKARPQELEKLLDLVLEKTLASQLACHFHNVHGTALANVWTAYQKGVRVFDGSLGGLGGCPYSKVPSGNVSTESLVYLLKSSESPLIPKLLKIGRQLEKTLGKKLPSQLIHSPYYLKNSINF